MSTSVQLVQMAIVLEGDVVGKSLPVVAMQGSEEGEPDVEGEVDAEGKRLL
jgi:hypothetical protein